MSRTLQVIGWREKIDLPQLMLFAFSVKVDTGARTTAIHAENVETFDKDGAAWVRFTPPDIGPTTPKTCEAAVFDTRDITNTSGRPEPRIIIRTQLLIAGRRWQIDVSLADRAPMKYPLILGRSALRGHNIAVSPGRSYLVSTKDTAP